MAKNFSAKKAIVNKKTNVATKLKKNVGVKAKHKSILVKFSSIINSVKSDLFGKKTAKSKRNVKNYTRAFFIIIIVGIIIGSAHGFYVSYVRDQKFKSHSGSALCNGELFSDKIIAESDDLFIMIYYGLNIKRGKVNFQLYDPNGKLVVEMSDWEDLLRQKSVKLEEAPKGTWTYKFICDKADVKYDISLETAGAEAYII